MRRSGCPASWCQPESLHTKTVCWRAVPPSHRSRHCCGVSQMRMVLGQLWALKAKILTLPTCRHRLRSVWYVLPLALTSVVARPLGLVSISCAALVHAASFPCLLCCAACACCMLCRDINAAQAAESLSTVSTYLQTAESDHFPLPADVQDVVHDCIRAVFGVLTRHNHLSDAVSSLADQLEAGQELVRDSSQYVDVLRAWKAAHR